MENTIESKNKYIPGICNLGKEELKLRKTAFFLATALLLIVIFLLQLFHTSHIWRLTVFIPAAYVAISYQQWYFRFCVNFGMKGVFNLGAIGKTTSVEQIEDIRKDKAKASKMIIAGLVFGAVVALFYYFV